MRLPAPDHWAEFEPFDQGRDEMIDRDLDEREQAANVELHQELIRVIHSAMMYGLPTDDAKLLCFGCGVDMRDIEQYQTGESK